MYLLNFRSINRNAQKTQKTEYEKIAENATITENAKIAENAKLRKRNPGKNFVGIFVQMMTPKGHFEIN